MSGPTLTKYAVLIFTRRDPGLLSDLALKLRQMHLFPEQWHSAVHSAGEVEIRLVLECDDEAARALRHHCEAVLCVRSVMIAAVHASNSLSPVKP